MGKSLPSATAVILICLQLFVSTRLIAEEASFPNQEVRESLRKIAQNHQNFSVQGMQVWERFLPVSAKAKEAHKFEFRRLGESYRFLSDLPSRTEQAKRVLVSTEPLSFDVELHSDGKELIKYLSPRRGVGFSDYRELMTQETFLCGASWSFGFDDFYRMIDEDRMKFGQVIRSDGDSMEVELESLVPRQELLPGDSKLTHYKGFIRLKKSPDWHITFISFTSVFSDKIEKKPSWTSGSFEYRKESPSLPPLLSSATWEITEGVDGPVGTRWTLKVDNIEFGVCHPDDFTLAGCGVKTINTAGAYSNIPLLAWYGGAVFVLCLVGLWLIRKRQRSAT